MKKLINIYYKTDLSNYHEVVTNLVEEALKKIEKTKKFKIEFTSQKTSDTLTQNAYEAIQKADIVLLNIESNDSSIIYELGLAHALKKPNILLVHDEVTLDFNLLSFKYVTYSGKTQEEYFINKITELIQEAIENPDKWTIKENNHEDEKTTKTVFVSYSHKDTSYLERLKIHMKALERKSSIQLWSDTLIQGGEKWKFEIEKALNKSAVAILLISADFLASDFIINSELQPLLKNAEEKGTTIIPIVLKPCRFLREASIAQFQSINDPSNPLCKLSEHEQEEIYEKVSHRIEIILQSE